MSATAVTRPPKSTAFAPVIGALVCLVLGLVSGLASGGGGGAWYQALEKPPGHPPAWVFGPVWTLLYLLMGVAAGRLFTRGAWVPLRRAASVSRSAWRLFTRGAWVPLGFFGVNFVLNLAWSPVFFGAHWLLASVAVILAMWVFLFLAIRAARRVDRVAALLWGPYLAWITYAGYLNVMIAGLNL